MVGLGPPGRRGTVADAAQLRRRIDGAPRIWLYDALAIAIGKLDVTPSAESWAAPAAPPTTSAHRGGAGRVCMVNGDSRPAVARRLAPPMSFTVYSSGCELSSRTT